MTSGQFQSFPIQQVFVNREGRQRKAIDDIGELALSIQRVGLINPIVIQHSGELRAGERRWEACKSLGWTHISVQFVEDLSEDELQLLELDENVRRKNLTWQEECDAIDKYHQTRARLDPEWNQTKTADALGMTKEEVGQKIAVQKAIKENNPRVVEAVGFSVARNIVYREAERKKASALAGLEEPKVGIPLLNADFNEWVKTYDGPAFNFIHCDFPYGIGADKQQQGHNIAEHGGYEDKKTDYFKLLETLERAMVNVVADSAHLIFWFSMSHHATTYSMLEVMGWNVNPFPLIWLKSDNIGLLPDPSRGPRRIYETAFFASRGDRKIIQAVSNAIASPTTAKIHMSEKPLPVLRHFFRMVVDEYSTVLDPTCGSANAIKAASAASSRLGIERDVNFFNLAKEHFDDTE